MKIRITVLLVVFAISSIAAQKVTLLFAGDAMQHQSQITNAFRNGSYDYSSYFEYLQEEISSADIAVVNLEVTLGGPPYTGYPQFSAPDEYARALKNAGFKIFLNANNHILDRGSKGVSRTLQILDSIHVAHTGVFRDEEERSFTYPMIYVCKGIRFAILNYTYGTNGFVVRPPICVNYINRKQISEDIQNARRLGAHIIIANMHWGEEYQMRENSTQSDIANFMVQEGVDLIIGSHPHVVQPSKVMTDFNGIISHVIVYSLGNLISGMIAPNTDGGQIVKIVVEKKPFRPAIIKSAEYTLVFRNKVREGNKVKFSLIPVSMAEKNTANRKPIITLSHDSYQRMMNFAKNARSIFNKYNVGVSEYKPRLSTLLEENDYSKIFSEQPFIAPYFLSCISN
ncbi:MAG: CapA family protein [Tannerellaceae bacterium]|jgi:poly-gamma-glutamate synthesis protein (capsule biosynthesis protein)|nr:CapA family protein [Tannerellaceae bacterium]